MIVDKRVSKIERAYSAGAISAMECYRTAIVQGVNLTDDLMEQGRKESDLYDRLSEAVKGYDNDLVMNVLEVFSARFQEDCQAG